MRGWAQRILQGWASIRSPDGSTGRAFAAPAFLFPINRRGNRPSIDEPFPVRISRNLTRALAFVVLAVLLVGGTSLALTLRILRNNEAVGREYGHILALDQIHTVFDDLIFQLHQADSTDASERTARALAKYGDLTRQLDVLAKVHGADAADPEREEEQVLLGELRLLGEEALALTQRMVAGPARFSVLDLRWLDTASQQVPRRVASLANLHRSRMARLLHDSEVHIRTIAILYVSFIVVGGALIALGSVALNRGITAPLGDLAGAARSMAEGRLEARVRVRFRNEIGQLSHAFNVMADRLQERERDLRGARDDLEQKVRETQTLYRFGTEIAHLQQLDRVLQSVVDRARDLLRGDAAALCLFTTGSNRLVARATSGPSEAFPAEGDLENRPAVPAEGADAQRLPCPFIQPEYARAHLVAPLRMGDKRIGAIYVSNREDRSFTSAEAELLAGLAGPAAIAIERARLSEELQSVAALEERERIAREMHDGLAQALALVHLKLQAALARAGDPLAVADALRELTGLTEQAYEEVRQSIFGLRTFVSRGLGLVPTLTEYLHEFSAQNAIAVELEVAPGVPANLPPASEVQAIRIIQEALANVRKHAAATRARVRLQPHGDWVRITIEDEGVGWDPATLVQSDRLHFGLQTMRERAEGLGGTLEVDTAPGRGTRIVATLPGEEA
jgi:nitrate/nitrite-specific signal transduction histidine kinase